MSQEFDDLSRRVAGKSWQSGPESWELDPTLGAPMIPPDEWSFWPYSSWTFSHVSENTRTARVWRGPGPVLPLPHRLRDISGIEFACSDGRRVTVQEFLEKDFTDGFLVLHRGEIVFETYMNGMEPHFKHIGRSVSKCVTGTMVGILVHRGLVDPESLVTRYLPELQATAYRGATVQHLLDHTAGATMGNGDKEFYLPRTQYYNFCVASGYFGPPEAHPDAPANTWASILTITEQEAPHGARFRYFDPNIDVLGFIMQRVTGKFLPELFSSELWAPMGAEEDACQIVDPARYAMTSGGFQATLRDWARFTLLHLRRGKLNGRQIVPSEWIDDTRAANDHLFQLHEEQLSSAARAYHNGFRIYDQKRRDYGHSGHAGQFLYIDPQSDFAAVKLSHWPDDAEVQLLHRPDRRVTTPPFGDHRYTLGAIRAIRAELAK
ncbi:serine hydrolase [Mesorhizobium sp.]|uniref:serine hydrolase domain-containing protein n=1 Tax=Mesorhizobium sp. TaxID=1871066 RepID=UPI00122AFD18|nr:serine hydrolase [Mesorhizobium sp.]TIS33942.1 MAG: serine hydrolase [Mesorhizobium sp.]